MGGEGAEGAWGFGAELEGEAVGPSGEAAEVEGGVFVADFHVGAEAGGGEVAAADVYVFAAGGFPVGEVEVFVVVL